MGVHHPGEPVAPLHQAKMTNNGGLRQACCARSVDVECPIFEGRRLSCQGEVRAVRARPGFILERTKSLGIPPVYPELQGRRQLGQDQCHPFGKLGIRNDVLGCDSFDAVGQRAWR
jgi:hypothetical protein